MNFPGTPHEGATQPLSHYLVLYRINTIKQRITELHSELAALPLDVTFHDGHVEAIEKLESAITALKHGAILPRVR